MLIFLNSYLLDIGKSCVSAVGTLPCSVPIYARLDYNKCIGNDTKAAARQSPSCIKKQKK